MKTLRRFAASLILVALASLTAFAGTESLTISVIQGPMADLVVSKAGTGTGTVTGTGINCGTDCNEQYEQGVNVPLAQTPSANSTFTSWSGACSGSGSCVVSMTTARSVIATFTQLIWHLNWTDVATDETTYEVERGPAAGGPFTPLTISLPVNTVAYNDNTVNVGTLYCYRVRARNATGPSGYSNVACTP